MGGSYAWQGCQKRYASSASMKSCIHVAAIFRCSVRTEETALPQMFQFCKEVAFIICHNLSCNILFVANVVTFQVAQETFATLALQFSGAGCDDGELIRLASGFIQACRILPRPVLEMSCGQPQVSHLCSDVSRTGGCTEVGAASLCSRPLACGRFPPFL